MGQGGRPAVIGDVSDRSVLVLFYQERESGSNKHMWGTFR